MKSQTGGLAKKVKILTDLLGHQNADRFNEKVALDTIRENLAGYSNKNITITECLSVTGPMTADLIVHHEPEMDVSADEYDRIIIIAVNYYVMLYMDVYTGFYAVNKKHICDQISAMVEDALKIISEKKQFKSYNLETAIQKSRFITQQLVDIYYRIGVEGCQRYVPAAIYSVLLAKNRNPVVNRNQIEKTVRTIHAEEYLMPAYNNDSLIR